MIKIPKNAKVGIDTRGGPVNGPFAAGVMSVLLPGAQQLGINLTNLYCNSGTVPGTVKAATGKPDVACQKWAEIRPDDIIVKPGSGSWWQKIYWRLFTGYRILRREAIFDSTPLQQLVQQMTPLDDVFSPDCLPVKFPTVDYLTGRKIVFDNKNPKHRSNWHAGECGSMALVPFIGANTIIDVVDQELLDEPYTRSGPLRDMAVAFDGGFVGNLMLETACRDEIELLFVVDINGLDLAPVESRTWSHWSLTLQRAFSVLVTTNDHRHLMGLLRMNEILAIRDELKRLAEKQLDADSRTCGSTKVLAAQMLGIVNRMDWGELSLRDKHTVAIELVEDREHSRPFDFSNFKPGETKYLIERGKEAARRLLDRITVG